MVDEKVILQVLAEQQEYVQSYEPKKRVGFIFFHIQNYLRETQATTRYMARTEERGTSKGL